jgi:parallel beta-helix repeat protein
MSRVLLLSVLVVGVVGEAQAALPADFFVAPGGNDHWSGKLAAPNAQRNDGPFASLTRAREAVRALKARGVHRPITVLIRGGTYYLQEVFQLGPQDSGSEGAPVIYAAYPGEKPVISAGLPLRNWRKAEGPLYVAEVPAARAHGWDLRQLRVGDERQIRARSPNFDPQHPYTHGWLFARPQPGFNGTGFGACVGNIHNVGDFLEYEIDIPADGEYRLLIYYGAYNQPFGRTSMDGQTSVSVDGGPPVPLVNLPDTGGWNTFAWSDTCATLPLTQGKHTLRWRNDKGGGLNLDAFLLTDDPAYCPQGTPPQPPAPGKHLLVVQWEAFTRGAGREMTVGRLEPPAFRDRLYFDPGAIQNWPGIEDAEIYVFPAWGWVSERVGIQRVDTDQGCLWFDSPAQQEIQVGNRFYLENLRAALDTPGEWFYDVHTGRLYYWPKNSDFLRQETVVAVLDRAVHLKGNREAGERVRYVELRGLTFKDTSYTGRIDNVYFPGDAAIWLDGAEHCVVRDCTFICVGGYAVRLNLDCYHNRIVSNYVPYPGLGGVLLTGSEKFQPSGNLIAGNVIHHGGCHYAHVAGVYLLTASGNTIAHNDISWMPRYGISWKSGSANNVVEYNDLHHLNLETNDTGGIECWMAGRGNIIRGNLIRDSIGLKHLPEGGVITPFFSWGIYLDDQSSGTLVEGNIVVRNVLGGIMIHGGGQNVVRNNIFVDGTESQVFYANYGEGDKLNVMTRNIFCWHNPDAKVVQGYGFERFQVIKEHDYNLYWLAGQKEPLPPAKLIFSLGGLGNFDLLGWQQRGFDQHSLVADPLFVDLAHDDYRLRPDSPAFRLGFRPIDTARFGTRGYRGDATPPPSR